MRLYALSNASKSHCKYFTLDVNFSHTVACSYPEIIGRPERLISRGRTNDYGSHEDWVGQNITRFAASTGRIGVSAKSFHTKLLFMGREGNLMGLYLRHLVSYVDTTRSRLSYMFGEQADVGTICIPTHELLIQVIPIPRTRCRHGVPKRVHRRRRISLLSGTTLQTLGRKA